jgi:pyruvate carboxylase
MEELKKESKKELSYQELQTVAVQLSEQNQRLQKSIQELNVTNILNRLTFLFKVVEHKEVFTENFSKAVIKEIEELMTLPENSDTKTDVKQEG